MYYFSHYQGEEERKYWNQMQLDRETKRANTKRPKKKGSVKVGSFFFLFVTTSSYHINGSSDKH